METPQNRPSLVTLEDIQAAAERLRGITVHTPLLPFGEPIPGDRHGHTRAWLKPEQLQPIGAFKLRGAYNAMAQLSAEERERGVVTASSGNHAQGVARAARLLGIHATVVMPSAAPQVKLQRVIADGASVILVGPSSDERNQRAHDLADQRGLTLIPSYDDPRIVAGQGTAGLEIVADIQAGGVAAIAPPGTPFSVLVPVGGGGLSAGIATAVKALRPEARVYGVEPELAADAGQSLREGRIVHWDGDLVGRTIADGVRTNALGNVTFPQLQAYLDGMLTVSETEICQAMLRTRDLARLIVEPAGAVPLAALLFHAIELPSDGPVVCVLSGGNVDPELYAELLARGAAADEVTVAERQPARL